MEILLSATNTLKEIVRDTEDGIARENRIIKHIRNASETNLFGLHFPQDVDWFNVTKPLTEFDLRGKVVVLDFFTYCCINCLHVIPHLRALEENFSVADGLVVIGIHSAKFENEKHSSNIACALKRYGITHPVINDSRGFMWDTLNVSCWPTIFIIGPQGQILFVLLGENCKNELFSYVKSTLKYYKSSLSSHLLPIICGNKTLSSNTLHFPSKISRFQNILAVSDSGNHRILVIDELGYIQFKIGGMSPGFQDGPFDEAKFNSPQGIAFCNGNKIYVADTDNHAIRLIDLDNLEVKTVVGTGVQGTDYIGGKSGTLQEISSPWDVCLVSSKHVKWCSLNEAFPRKPKTINYGTSFNSPPPPPPSFTVPPPRFEKPVEEAVINSPGDCSVTDDVLLIAMSGLHQIWALFLRDTIWWKGKKYEKNICVAIAGSGKEENRNNRYAMNASFAQPSSLAYNSNLKALFIADSESSSIRKMSLEDGVVSHVVGGSKNPTDLFNFGDIDGNGFDAKLQHPLGLACDTENNILYVCDTYNHKLKKVDLVSSECSSLHKQSDLFNEPGGCCLNESKEMLYVADTNNDSISVFNIKKNMLEKLYVREKTVEEFTKLDQDGWELTEEVSKNGGSITLIIQLKPTDVRGSWRLEVGSSSVKSNESKGVITSEPQKLHLIVPSSESETVDSLKILFNLSFCRENVCIYKKFSLNLLIKRSLKGKEFAELEFKRTVS